MAQFLKFAMLLLAGFAALSAPAFAVDEAAPAAAATAEAEQPSLITFSSTFGAGLIVIGAGLGISRLSAAAFESMARQPEVVGDIRGSMIIVAAMIEGAAVIGLIVCLIA
ncbi:MAG: ATP synthase F0 subunit C [Planctomycetota bacterium]